MTGLGVRTLGGPGSSTQDCHACVAVLAILLIATANPITQSLARGVYTVIHAGTGDDIKGRQAGSLVGYSPSPPCRPSERESICSTFPLPQSSGGGPVWQNLTPNIGGSPSGRYGAAMAYDAADGYDVLFGGFNGSGPYTPLNDTWVFADGAWSQIHPPLSPPWLLSASMAYDAAGGYVLMFGGRQVHSLGSFPPTDQTWAYKGGTWTNLTRSVGTAPSPRYDAVASYDPADRSVVLFGGTSTTGAALNDTWLFQNGSWSRLTSPRGPGAWLGSAGTFSGVEGGVVLLGGASGNETWVLSNRSWTNVSLGHAPPARALARLAPYDLQGDLVLFGGANATEYLNDTWTFSGGVWTELSPAIHPIVGTEAAVAADPRDGFVLWFGGDDHPPAAIGLDYFSNGTWAFGPALLARPLVNPNPSDLGLTVTVRDPYNNATSPYSFSWNLGDGNQSTVQSLTHLYASPGVYNVSLSVRSAQGDFNNSSVVVIVNALPSATIAASPAATDVGYAVNLSAGVTDGTPPFQYAWTLGDGNGSSSATAMHAYAQPGRYNVSLLVTDAVGITASAWRWLNVSDVPMATLGVSVPFADVGQNVTLTAIVRNGTDPIGYAFQGVPGSCPAPYGPVLVCPLVSPGNYSMTATATDAVGATAVTPQVLFTVSSLPSATLTLSRTAIDLGQSVTMVERTVVSGAGGLTFRYQGLPPGCSTPTYPYYTCTPTSAGNYSISVTITDRAGGSGATGPVLLVVNGRLNVTLTFAPSTVTLGGATLANALVTGGTGPFSFTYLFLPPGCSSANLSTLSCIPNETGEWNATVRVGDATGAAAEGNATILVSPQPVETSSTSVSPILLVGIFVIVVAVVAVVVLLRLRRRRPPDVPPIPGPDDLRGEVGDSAPDGSMT